MVPRPIRPGWVILLVASLLAGAGLLSARLEPYRPRVIDVAPEPEPWLANLVLIPNELPEPPPVDKLEARLAALARRVEAASANIDRLPMVAFDVDALRGDIEQAIARIDDRAQVSVHVRDLESDRVLFDYYGDTLLNPASNHKLLTSSAALELLGSDYVFETRVLLVGESLILVGEGDPTLDADGLRVLVNEVAERVPVATLTEIVVDDSAFSPRSFGPGYSEHGVGASYEAPSGALSLNFNTVEITVYPVGRSAAVKLEPDSTHVIVDNQAKLGGGSSDLDVRAERSVVGDATRESALTKIEVVGTLARGSRGYKVRRRVVDPGMFAGGAFAMMLSEASQSARLPVRVGTCPPVDLGALDEHGDGEALTFPVVLEPPEDGRSTMLVARRRSPPLIEIVGGVLAYSNNFAAEQILRTLGWRMTGDPGDWDNGSEVVRGYWIALGNDPAALVFENASGLSATGRVTTSGLVDLMAVATRTQAAGASLIDALPVAGTETLRTRLRRSGKRVRAKTGTLDGVSGLSGVITTEAGVAQVAFSILINVREDDRVRAGTRRKIEDRIVMDVLEHIDGWAATRGTLILDLEPLPVTPGLDLQEGP
jgi:D-alanyl-D-alanine carboxypeptidase/D-alanyl-D-alanine-endopeptidase (penicillin-binding protein 4)